MENKFAEARKTMREAFANDPELWRGYVDNVAMWLYDNVDDSNACLFTRSKEARDGVAEDILNLIFG